MKGSLNRLVNTSKHILRLLYRGGTNANQIIKQTSSDRTYVFSVIKDLHREGLISESIDTNHSQRKIKNLTALGNDIAEIIELVESCYDSCGKLKQESKKYPLRMCMKANLVKSDNEQIPSIQLQNNLEPEGKNTDIQKRAIGMANLDYAAADYVRDFVIFRYFSFSRKYNIKKITNNILEQIISEATKRQMDAIMKGIGWIEIVDPSELIAEFGEHATRIASLPQKMRNYGLLNNNFSGKEKAKEALLSVIPMLKSERESILQSIDNNNKQLGKIEVLDKFDELNRRLGLEKAKPRPKKDPSELEVKALYQEIRKALS